VLLADELVERARTHSHRERRVGSRHGRARDAILTGGEELLAHCSSIAVRCVYDALRMPPRSLVALLAVVIALPVLSGCGADDTLSPEAVASAADATVAKGGAKIAMELNATLPGADKLTMSGEGAVDTRTRRGHLTLEAAQAPAGIDKEKFTQEIVFDKLIIYLRGQALAAVLDKGKRWIKIDIAKAGKEAGLDLSSVMQTGQDPSQSLRLLKAVSDDVKTLGEEDVRGVKTTHYKATIDLEKYPDTVPANDRAAARATIETLTKATGESKSPVEFWLDEDKLVRRYVQSLSVKTGATKNAIRQKIEFYDYGAKVDVTIPPAGEVQDLTDLAATGLGGSTS